MSERFNNPIGAIDDISTAWQAGCRRGALPGCHDLRHLAVLKLICANVGRAVAMATRSHETEATFRLYYIASKENLRYGRYA